MSKDSSPTYIHMHHPRLADYFEDFTRPHTSLYSNLAAAAAQQQQQQQQHQHPHNNGSNSAAGAVTYGSSGSPSTMIPSFLPIEDIYVPPQYQPLNPEDEDDVVPDQHAAFGIARAMDAATRREPVWRDLGLQELVRGAAPRGGGGGGGLVSGGGHHHHGGHHVGGAAGSFLSSSSSAFSSSGGVAPGWRLKQAGALMGGRRTICLR